MSNSDSASSPSPRDQSLEDEDEHAAADRAAEGLKGQIAALRRQVKDAQDTLRDHKRRQDGRSFKED